MYEYKMPALDIGSLHIPVPIIQGGMGVGISLSGLASAVASEGGLGVISSVGLGLLMQSGKKVSFQDNLEGLRQEIRLARSRTTGALGVNLMVALTDYDHLLKASIDEKIDIVFLGAGLPIKQPSTLTVEELNQTTTRFAVIVSSARATKLIFSTWKKRFGRVPDAVVVEGPLAGGHLGFSLEGLDDPENRLELLVPQVIEAVRSFEDHQPIPVIAAGGIYTGGDIHRFLELGAAAVQMGTRFVATTECDAADSYKQKYIDCQKEEVVIIKSPVGMPGRAIENNFLKEVAQGHKMPFQCVLKCLKTCKLKDSQYCIAQALLNARKGDMEQGFAFAGANAWRVDRIVSVHELIQSLKSEYDLEVRNSRLHSGVK